MKNSTTLTALSLLSIVLVALHVSDDIVRGYAPGGLENLPAILVIALWLYAALVWPQRRLGLVILLLGSLLAVLMPVLHMKGKGVGGTFGQSPGALVFIWTLYILGIIGTVTAALSIRGLIGLRSGQRP